MNDTFLIVDAPFLCYRAKYGMKQDLMYGGSVTSIVYTFLREIVAFQQQFCTSKLLFCFDSKSSKRKDIYPPYKGKRHSKELTEEEIEFEKAFRYQVKKLRTEYLPEIGFRNIYRAKGFESDDLMARLASYISTQDDRGILITADHDMFQCITHNVSFYNPNDKKELTLQGFKKKFGIVPLDWIKVKAIAGCTSDCVEGIRGVGEKTALKYIKGELKSTTKTYQAIQSREGQAIIKRNWNLVCLPFEGTPILNIKEDKLSISGWKDVCKKLGFNSLSEKFDPFPYERRRKEKENT